MNRSLCVAVLCAGSSFAGHAIAADGCKFTTNTAATVDAAGATRIVVGAGAGDLKIRGASGGKSEVQANGRACASTEELLAQIKLESRRDGDTVYLKTVLPDTDINIFGVRYASLDLTVAVPATVAVQLEDSSGDIELKNVQSATVDDGSGDLEIDDVAGSLDVTDSSGDIGIHNVGGNLSVKDSSGDMQIQDVRGSVQIPIDSSGDMRISRVTGGVHIMTDSSGNIVIDHVKQDVNIDTDSSGDISVDDIGGNFTVDKDSSGEIHRNNVVGRVSLPEGK